ncbi:MAG TPA: hypothetical protein VNX21_03730 [Candidatus Thermoplasmatota archaeon]|nr:hypothetical protein [Candidatus Thermoplasmatota archaeon]
MAGETFNALIVHHGPNATETDLVERIRRALSEWGFTVEVCWRET